MTGAGSEPPFVDVTETELRTRFEEADYVAGDDLVTTVLLTLRLGKPLLVEGQPGSGKTELGSVLADAFDVELVRLQCYEGLTAENTLYEWNYAKQLLTIQSRTRTQPESSGDGEGVGVFDESFLLERPLLRALRGRPSVLLIDEIDRADREFEAFLLEFLSEFQVTIPELGTVAAETPPVVVITSNRTRGLSDALKRRCLYLHVSPPAFDVEREIVRRKVPELDDALATEVVGAVQRLREAPLVKQPGVAETLDWARALTALRDADGDAEGPLAPEEVERTIGCLLKEAEDVARLDEELVTDLLEPVGGSSADGG